jgi:peptidoglycan hydrolase-like protein with peptidoglycan-binding domain
MCLVTEPAAYKTVSKRVLTKPETTREVEIPAEYKTVKVRRELNPPTTRKTRVPEEYATVSKTVMVKPSYMEWRPILCETNAKGDVVMKIQRALKSQGHDPGPIDGILGPQTRTALSSFQESQKLPSGALTFDAIRALGVDVSSR